MNKIISIFLVACVISLPAISHGDTTDAEHIENAQSYLDRGEQSAAIIELKNALRQNKENGQARRLLGIVYLDTGKTLDAVKELQLASKFGVADEAVLPLLARALLQSGNIEELQALSVENIAANDQKAAVLAAQGTGLLMQQDVDAAAEKINQAVSLAPQLADAGMAKVLLLLANKDDALARKELDRVFELDAENAAAWALLGDLENRNMDFEKAELAYSKAAENRANNASDILKRAQARINLKKYQAAQKDIDILKKRLPRNAAVNYTQGIINYNNNLFLEAKEDFSRALSANDRYLQAMFYLALTDLRLGNWVQAEHYAKQFHAAAPGSIQGRKLLATIEFENQQYDQVVELIRPVVAARENDMDAINLLSHALLKQNKAGDAEEAANLLLKAASQQPDSANAQMRLGASLLTGGKYAEAIEHIEKAIEIDPQLQKAHILLVQSYLYQKNYDKALAAANAYRDQYPDNAMPYNMIGNTQLASGHETAAVEAFTRAREIVPGDPEANHKLAALAIRNKNYQEAGNYYQDVLKHRENHLSTLLKLAVLDTLENNDQAAYDHLQKAATAHPQAIQPKAMLARYYLLQGEPTAVPALMLELTEKQKNTPAVLEVMALSQLAQKQYSRAKVGLETLAEKEPDSVQAHLLLARAYAGLGDSASLKKELERSLELAPRNFAARLALARLLLLEGQKEKVAEQLSVLNELSPDHPSILQLKASLAQAKGDRETATALLEDVFEKSPSTANMLSVARQKWAMDDKMAAIELQQEWTAEHPDDLLASLALATTYLQDDQVEQAIDQYKQVLVKEENNVIALNNLAWSLRDEQPDKALEYAERAAELAPNSSRVRDTFAVVLLKNGEIDLAKRNIEKALAIKPKNPSFLYHSAMIDVAAGDKALAIKTLQALLVEGNDFAEKAEAQKLLSELQAGS